MTAKFRAKHLNGDTWAYGYYAHLGERDYILRHKPRPTFYGAVFSPVQPDTLGQFTGLTDKHGKEIYEGDVVTLTVIVCVVEWDDDEMRWVAKTMPQGGHKVALIKERAQLCEVIGNIHDNPDYARDWHDTSAVQRLGRGAVHPGRAGQARRVRDAAAAAVPDVLRTGAVSPRRGQAVLRGRDRDRNVLPSHPRGAPQVQRLLWRRNHTDHVARGADRVRHHARGQSLAAQDDRRVRPVQDKPDSRAYTRAEALGGGGETRRQSYNKAINKELFQTTKTMKIQYSQRAIRYADEIRAVLADEGMGNEEVMGALVFAAAFATHALADSDPNSLQQVTDHVVAEYRRITDNVGVAFNVFNNPR